MLWRKRSKREDSAPNDGKYMGTANGGCDTAIDFLRSFGRYAFEISGVDVATVSRQCEAWASHLAVGAAARSTERSSACTGSALSRRTRPG